VERGRFLGFLGVRGSRDDLDMSGVPEVKIVTTFFACERCAVCGREWDGEYPVPTAYTVKSIESELPPMPVCDYCIEEKYPPELFKTLMEDREYFWAN
jgi:hypothetical protein